MIVMGKVQEPEMERGECVAITIIIRTPIDNLFQQLPPEVMRAPIFSCIEQALQTAASVKELAGNVLEITLDPKFAQPD